jgi:cell division protein FtsB
MANNLERKGQLLNIALEIFLVLLLITAAVLILPAWHNYRKMRAEEIRQQGKLDEEKRERQKQLEKLSNLKNDPATIEKVAREKYKFVKKGDIVLVYPAEKKPVEKNLKKSPKKI